MSFENDYNAFMKSVVLKNYLDAEHIISQCDTKNKFILKAINDCGEICVQVAVNSFRSVGLKRSLESVFEEQEKHCFENEFKANEVNEKIILIHQKNKMKNKEWHLSA